MLPDVVEELRRRGIAQESEGAVCVFLEGQPAPMIVRKQDGAFLYATTDLATIRYRMEQWRPDAILYVVDHRQACTSASFSPPPGCWATTRSNWSTSVSARCWARTAVPSRPAPATRWGLEGLLDEAVRRAARIVAENDDAKPDGPELSRQQRPAWPRRWASPP